MNQDKDIATLVEEANPPKAEDASPSKKMLNLWKEKKLCLSMDIVFQVAIRDNIPLAQHILDSLFGEGAYTILAIDSDFEIMMRSFGDVPRLVFEGRGPKRELVSIVFQLSNSEDAPYHDRACQALIDDYNINFSRHSFGLRDTVIITFIDDPDIFEDGKPLLTIVLADTRTKKEIDIDMGMKHMFVNFTSKDRSSAVGRLIGEFCTTTGECLSGNAPISKPVEIALRFLEEYGGDEKMWERAIEGGPGAVAEYRYEMGMQEAESKIVYRMSKNGKSPKEIAKDIGKTEDEVNWILSRRKNKGK